MKKEKISLPTWWYVGIVVAVAIALLAVLRARRWKRMGYVSTFVENPAKLVEGADLDAINPELLKAIKFLAKHLGDGGKLHVNSGFRTVAKNTSVGGAGHSAHLDGDAADLAVSNPMWAARLAWIYGIRRIGVGAHYIHIDVSDHLPSPAIWVYAGSGWTDAEAESIINR